MNSVKLKSLILKIKNLKTTNSDHKKAIKQGSRHRSVESFECVIHMPGDTVQLAFNYLSYKSLFDSAKYVIHIAVAT